VRAPLALLVIAALLLQPVAAQELKPFIARYAWTYRGISAGQSTLSLARRDDGRWIYSSRSVARGIFRLIAPGDITQDSVFRLDGDQVLPEHYRGDDGTPATKRDVNLTFDWHAHRVSGIYEDVPVDLPIEPGVHDDMSIQVALMTDLLRGITPMNFRLIDRNLIKNYQYSQEGSLMLQTRLGLKKVVIYRSRKVGSRSSTLFWCAPDLGYLPLKVERHDGADKVEWAMSVQSASRE
jgi:hypothetical protein